VGEGLTYLNAAVEYLGTTPDDPHARAVATTAQAIADIAVFDYLRTLRAPTNSHGGEPALSRALRVRLRVRYHRAAGRVGSHCARVDGPGSSETFVP